MTMPDSGRLTPEQLEEIRAWYGHRLTPMPTTVARLFAHIDALEADRAVAVDFLRRITILKQMEEM